MKNYIYFLGIVLFLLPLVTHAQIYQELISRQKLEPLDSNSTFVSIWLANSISKVPAGRDFTSKNYQKTQQLNPSFIMEIMHDITYSHPKDDFQIFIGWQGRFFLDEVLSRVKTSLVKKDMVYSVFGSMRIIRDEKSGEIKNRQGSFSQKYSIGLGIEQYRKNTTAVLEGEHSGIHMYHLAEVSGRLQMYPKFWISIRSESLRGYGPRIYFKSPDLSWCIHSGMNIAPPVYRDHRYVQNSFEFGIRHVFF